jgi:hypothetical protein
VRWHRPRTKIELAFCAPNSLSTQQRHSKAFQRALLGRIIEVGANMGWRFRKRFSPLPGIRLNFSPRGISTSVGAGPVRLYLGSQGAAVTARVPGTGIYTGNRFIYLTRLLNIPYRGPQLTISDFTTPTV